jgi:hypothetical protein
MSADVRRFPDFNDPTHAQRIAAVDVRRAVKVLHHAIEAAVDLDLVVSLYCGQHHLGPVGRAPLSAVMETCSHSVQGMLVEEPEEGEP